MSENVQVQFLSISGQITDDDAEYIPPVSEGEDATEESEVVMLEVDEEESKAIKRTWTKYENRHFMKIFQVCIRDKRNPNKIEMQTGCLRLPGRKRAQIWAKVNNIIKNKQAVPTNY